MKFKIIQETENPLFNRKEIQAEIKSNSNPGKEEILKLLAEETSVPEENIKIKGIHGKFGSEIFKITANVYASKKDREKTEQKTKKEKEKDKKELEEKLKTKAEAKKAIAEAE